jgi:hypothetical protein
MLHQFLGAQEDPCAILRPEICLNDSIPAAVEPVKKSSMREWNLMVSAQKSNNGCKWSTHSTFKQTLKFKAVGLEIFDETSMECLPDSQPVVSRDLLRLQAEVAFNRPEKPLNIQGGVLVQTAKFPVLDQRADSAGKNQFIRTSGLLNPLLIYPAMGMVVELKSGPRIDFGLIGMKVAWQKTKTASIHEKQFNLEGGPRLQITFTKLLFSRLQWEHYSFFFWNVSSGTLPEAEIRNIISLRAGQNLKAGLQTRYTYQPVRWPPAEFTGELSLGLCFSKQGH